MEKSILHRLSARFRKTPSFYKALELTGSNLSDKKWVFILGCYNSGTTLLNQILANHPNISGLPDEGVMLSSELLKPEDFGWRRMWWKCMDDLQQNQKISLKTAQKVKKHWSHFYGNTPYLLEKSISNVCRIPFFNAHFQPAYFIHIFRNPYAVAEGIQRKAEIIPGNEYDKVKRYPIELCTTQWIENLKVVEQEKEDLQHFMEISYEAFTENPDKSLKKITDFLQLEPFNDRVAKQSFSVHEKNSAIKNMNARSLSKLSEEDIATINLVAGDFIANYKYEVL